MRDKVLVAGASGLIGVSAVEAFLDAGWDVIGVSRRKPELPSGRDFDFASVDLRDEKAAREALSPLAGPGALNRPAVARSRCLLAELTLT